MEMAALRRLRPVLRSQHLLLEFPAPDRLKRRKITSGTSRSVTMRTDESVRTAQQHQGVRCNAREHCIITYEDIRALREVYWELTPAVQSKWLLAKMIAASHGDGSKERVLYTVQRNTLCASCMRSVFSISDKKWYGLRRKLHGGEVHYMEDGRGGDFRDHPQRVAIIEWLRGHVDAQGQCMPNTDQIHLPPGRWRTVYEQMLAALDGGGEEPATYSYFMRVVHLHFPMVRVPAEQRFTKCEECLELKSRRRKTNSRVELKVIAQARNEHLRKVLLEREKYWDHRRKAKSEKDDYLSIIIDGMDQTKTVLPRMAEETSKMSRADTLQVHVTGVLVHGRGAFVYLTSKRTSADSNLCVDSIIRTLLKLPAPLPPVLYIQGDNHSGDMKNKFVMGFLALLVQMKVFQKVKFNLLPVGHTHEDIDQMFSRFSIALGNTNTESPQHLEERLSRAYKPHPDVTYVQNTVDFKTWITPYLLNIGGHKPPHTFKFHRSNPDSMQFKMWTRHTIWKPQAWLKFLTSSEMLGADNLTAGYSEILELDADLILRNMDRIFRPFFVREESYGEWEEFFAAWKNYVEPEFNEVWHAFMERFNNQDGDNAMLVAEKKEEECDSEEAVPEDLVYIGHRRKKHAEELELVFTCGTMVAIWTNGDEEDVFECGRILAEKEESVEIQWYGTKSKGGTGVWGPLLKQGTTEKYTQEVSKESVVWSGFELTKGNKIRVKDLRIIRSRLESAVGDKSSSEDSDEGEGS
jgi:hypothetical protein